MGYLDKYLENSKLSGLSRKARKNLQKLEDKLAKRTEELGSPFDELLKEYGPMIVDLAERLQEHFKDYKFSVSKFLATVRVVYAISTEVAQMVNGMWGKLKIEGMTAEQEKEAKVGLGTEMVYFVWKIWDPLKDVAGWLPFKGSLEKWLINTIAEYAIEAALDFFEANLDISKGMTTFSVKKGKKKTREVALHRRAF